MEEENIPGMQGVDTRELTKKIREKGTMLGRIVYQLPVGDFKVTFTDPNTRNLVEEVSVKVQTLCSTFRERLFYGVVLECRNV